MRMDKNIEKKKIVDFWSKHPLGSYEIKEDLVSGEYFRSLERIREDSSRFVMDFYKFEKMKEKKVLDIGCGPGWITHKYAQHGANIYSIDLTLTAIKLAKRYLTQDRLNSILLVSDAENIPYKNAIFDFVICDGVLHHTTGTEQGVGEVYRVLSKGGRAAVSFYYKNIFLRRPLFMLTKLTMRALGVKMHGVKKISLSLSREEFGKLYDGVDNPLGKIYSKSSCEQMLKNVGFKIRRSRAYYFPKRFFPLGENTPFFINKFLDRLIGTMIFFEVEK